MRNTNDNGVCLKNPEGGTRGGGGAQIVETRAFPHPFESICSKSATTYGKTKRQKKRNGRHYGQPLEERSMVSDVLLFFGFLEVLAIFRFSRGFGHLPKSAKGKEQLSLSYCSHKQVQYQFCMLAAQFLFWY